MLFKTHKKTRLIALVLLGLIFLNVNFVSAAVNLTLKDALLPFVDIKYDYANGIIDEVTIYNRALSLEEINALYSLSPQGMGEMWNCTVKAIDSTGAEGINSKAITMPGYALPNITGITITPSPAYDDSELNCSAIYGNPDGNKGNVTLSWYNGSTLYWQITQLNKLNNEVVNDPLTWADKNGLVGYWKFSEGNGTQTRDISGNENNGTLTNFNFNSNDGWVDGKFGKGLLFDGSNDYVNAGNAASLNWGTGDLTFEMWLGPRTDYGDWSWIVSKNAPGGPLGLEIATHVNLLRASFGAWFTDVTAGSSRWTLSATSWHHIVITRKSGTVYTYVNGLSYGTPVANNYDFSGVADKPLIFGVLDPATSTWQWFNGTIDEVRIYNRSLTSAEINESYSASPHARGETWNCTINATDSGGAAGLPNSTTRTISNAIPDVPEIGGPENATRTIGNSQTLRCTNSSDTDGDAINYVFYGDTTANPTTMLQNSTSTTYTWATTDGQTYYWRCKAEDGVGGVSGFTAQKTFTENTAPTSVNMVYPSDSSTTTNRTPQFNWTASTDAEGDSIIYQINITCYPSCSADNRLPNSSTNQNWTTLTPRLKNFWDDNYYYNWTVRAWDGYEFSTWNSVPYTLKLSSLVSLSMINSSVNFSVLSMGETANTTTNNPVPLSIRNDGNSFVSVNMSNETSLLWTSQPTASEYFKYRIDNVTGREGSFNWTLSTTAWTNVPTSNNTVINYLNYSDATDSAEIEILVTVPPQEQAGTKSSRLVFTGFYVREI